MSMITLMFVSVAVASPPTMNTGSKFEKSFFLTNIEAVNAPFILFEIAPTFSLENSCTISDNIYLQNKIIEKKSENLINYLIFRKPDKNIFVLNFINKRNKSTDYLATQKILISPHLSRIGL